MNDRDHLEGAVDRERLHREFDAAHFLHEEDLLAVGRPRRDGIAACIHRAWLLPELCHAFVGPGGMARHRFAIFELTTIWARPGEHELQRRVSFVSEPTPPGPPIEPASSTESTARPIDPAEAAYRAEKNPLKRLGKVLGPGLITGASDDDPSGIGTYAQAGAQYGFATLWTTLAMLPMMTAVQYMCAKIGLVTGQGLAGVLREHYPRAVLYPAVIALVLANTLNAGADIGAIAAAINLLVPIPAIVFIVPVSLAMVGLQVFGSYRLIEKVFKWLALALLAYIGAALFARPDLGAVVAGSLVPTIRLDAKFVAILVALLGTTISPYLFFWQASQEVEEQISMGRRRLRHRQGASAFELRFALLDTIAGMTFSEVVAYFIILATGATLFVAGKTQISSATDAAEALRPSREMHRPSCSRSGSSAPACWPCRC